MAEPVPADLDALRAEHVEAIGWQSGDEPPRCRSCAHPWPCRTVAVLAELEGARQKVAAAEARIGLWMENYRDKSAEAAALSTALGHYGAHHLWCRARSGSACECGFDAALAGARPEQEKSL